jgi:hypothetical protein
VSQGGGRSIFEIRDTTEDPEANLLYICERYNNKFPLAFTIELVVPDVSGRRRCRCRRFWEFRFQSLAQNEEPSAILQRVADLKAVAGPSVCGSMCCRLHECQF